MIATNRHGSHIPVRCRTRRHVGEVRGVCNIASDQLGLCTDRNAVESFLDALVVKPDGTVRRAATDPARVVSARDTAVLPGRTKDPCAERIAKSTPRTKTGPGEAK